MSPVLNINVNTAPIDVLRSIGIDSGMAANIVERRTREPFANMSDVSSFLGPQNAMIVGRLDVTSNVFKVDSFATAGGYTKQVEAVIVRRGDGTGADVKYWRAM